MSWAQHLPCAAPDASPDGAEIRNCQPGNNQKEEERVFVFFVVFLLDCEILKWEVASKKKRANLSPRGKSPSTTMLLKYGKR